ncbi:YggT family protein [Vibrio cholerae]|uniref:YggT family protein n=1 Tax=Vibrio cholerae TaxID=666 RepID=UPI002AB3E891|nr:YggT family protein [Vibrio cholerae]EJL6266755.1 YggT family protein [Vibrio cholerae]EJL6280428.1 YggT family protein [Vibrio cholerae]EJX9125183.1 YggT family protein [Vibrio cholerae]EJY0788390.1 YggT family protein [Vibrio cholerae]MDY7588495.1 YggT family protein [Vibrio cholerae]
MNSLSFLINTLFDLYIMVVILRIWLQAARADFYNPFSQFIVKATQPVVGPLRRVIPSLGSMDLATVLFAYILLFFKLALLAAISPQDALTFTLQGHLIGALFGLLKITGKTIFYVLLIRAILSWVSQGRSPIEYVFNQLTEPMLAPIRRIIPVMGGFDLSVLVLFIALQFANFLIIDLLDWINLGSLWYRL